MSLARSRTISGVGATLSQSFARRVSAFSISENVAVVLPLAEAAVAYQARDRVAVACATHMMTDGEPQRGGHVLHEDGDEDVSEGGEVAEVAVV